MAQSICALTQGDGRPARAAMYRFEKEAKDERSKILAKLEAESPQRPQTNRFEYRIPTKLRQKVPRQERGDYDEGAGNINVEKRPFTADELRVRKKEQFHGVRQLQQAAHGARARQCMDWSDVYVHKRNQPKETEPWRKAGYDHPHVVKGERGGWMCRSKEGWPMHEGGGYLGAVKGWHGGEYGKDPAINNRVAVPGRAAYGRGWELRVNDSIGREAFVHNIPHRELHTPTPPWQKAGKDYGPWNQPEYHGRRGPRTHQVLQHRGPQR